MFVGIEPEWGLVVGDGDLCLAFEFDAAEEVVGLTGGVVVNPVLCLGGLCATEGEELIRIGLSAGRCSVLVGG